MEKPFKTISYQYLKRAGMFKKGSGITFRSLFSISNTKISTVQKDHIKSVLMEYYPNLLILHGYTVHHEPIFRLDYFFDYMVVKFGGGVLTTGCKSISRDMNDAPSPFTDVNKRRVYYSHIKWGFTPEGYRYIEFITVRN